MSSTDRQTMQENFGTWLKRVRAQRRLSQKEVAKEAGLSASYISLIERTATQENPSKPSAESAEAIAIALGVAPREALILAGFHVPNPLANTDAELEVIRVHGGRTITIIGLDMSPEDKGLVRALISRLMNN